MEFTTNKIYHGAAYYPECWDEKEMDKEIALMKKLGINVVRMAEFAWAVLEPKKDEFNIGIFDYPIQKLAENGIKTVMCTPTATPPRWLTKEYPDSLYVDRWMNKANHGSREHVCFSSPDYIERTRIIIEKMAEHYGNNPNVIAWQTHNEYNCPPVNECVCDNCQNAWREWLKKRYGGDIEKLNHEWGATVWSTRYNSFDAVIAPRPTPNGHSAAMSTNYSLFTFDNVAKYNRLQVETLKKYVKVPITHNTNRVFHFDHETLFEPLDFVAFDDYCTWDDYQEKIFMQELCRGLKPDVPFWEMETSSGTSGHLHASKPFHKRGFVKAEAVSGFFSGSVGFSYWLFRQHRGGTEMTHGHMMTAFGSESNANVNVLDVKAAIEELNDFIVSTKPARAKVALMYSDKARMFVDHETLNGNNYANDIYGLYKSILRNSYYRDMVWEGSDLTPYDVIIVPFIAHVSDELREKLEAAAKRGATVVIGPYSGWRTAHHAYETEAAFGKTEKLFGCKVEDVMPLVGQEAKYEAFGMEEPLGFIAAITSEGIGKIKGGYLDGKSVLYENKLGKGKVVFWGTKFNEKMTDAFLANVIGERVEKTADVEEGIVYYHRTGEDGKYLCLINMTHTPKAYKITGDYETYVGTANAKQGSLDGYGYLVLKEVK